MFESATEVFEENRVHRYRILSDGRTLTYAAVIDMWQHDHSFRENFTSLLADSPFESFRWETPSLTTVLAERPFEFVLVNTPTFASRRSDRKTYSDYFTDADVDNGVVSFPNISRDATLIVPSPRSTDDNYGHLAAFVRGAPKAQVASLWLVLARTIKARLSETPIWVSTAGGGVAWLHVRIDRRPKYYAHAEYKTLPR